MRYNKLHLVSRGTLRAHKIIPLIKRSAYLNNPQEGLSDIPSSPRHANKTPPYVRLLTAKLPTSCTLTRLLCNPSLLALALIALKAFLAHSSLSLNTWSGDVLLSTKFRPRYLN